MKGDNMFQFLKKEAFKVVSPVTGKCVAIQDVPDQVFSAKMMGDGFAIIPDDNVVVAPISGVAKAVFPTKHAVGIKNKDGVEVIVHVGLDTVELNGEGFKTFISQGSKVKAGQPIIEFDKELIEGKGYNLITMVVFPSGYNQPINLEKENQKVQSGETLIQ